MGPWMSRCKYGIKISNPLVDFDELLRHAEHASTYIQDKSDSEQVSRSGEESRFFSVTGTRKEILVAHKHGRVVVAISPLRCQPLLYIPLDVVHGIHPHKLELSSLSTDDHRKSYKFNLLIKCNHSLSLGGVLPAAVPSALSHRQHTS